MKRAEVVADAEVLKAGRVPPEQWSARMGMSADAIKRALYRAGRPDLARPAGAVAARLRSAKTEAKRCPGCGGPVSADPRRRWCSHKCWEASDEARESKVRAGRAGAARLSSPPWRAARST